MRTACMQEIVVIGYVNAIPSIEVTFAECSVLQYLLF